MFVIEGKNTFEAMGPKLALVGSARTGFSRTKFDIVLFQYSFMDKISVSLLVQLENRQDKKA